MCGRYVLPDEDSIGEYGVINRCFCRGWFKPQFNVPPTVQVPIIVKAEGGLYLRSARWGLIPSWWTQEKPPSMTFNARTEDAAQKPTWRDCFRSRRCLMPARGWYEWNANERVQGEAGPPVKQPYFISCPDTKAIAFAGLWSVWERLGAEPVVSCAVLTKPASSGISFIHDRMPVVIKPEYYDSWLNSATTASGVAERIADARVDLVGYPVSRKVNHVRNDGPELIERGCGNGAIGFCAG